MEQFLCFIYTLLYYKLISLLFIQMNLLTNIILQVSVPSCALHFTQSNVLWLLQFLQPWEPGSFSSPGTQTDSSGV